MTTAEPGGASRPAQPRLDMPAEYAVQLRERVLDELALVQGRVALAEHLDPSGAKEQLRYAHSTQRDARLHAARRWLLANEDALLENFANGADVDPAKIDPVVIPVRTPADVDLFKYATLQWSVPVSAGYGRRTRFLVRDRQNEKLVAIFALGDPVIAQSARDAAIRWNTQQRNARLYNVFDAFILGAVEPYRQLLAGKLAALLTISNETRDILFHKYNGMKTGIRGEFKDPTPVLITTSSALGKSSVYNRVTLDGNLMFRSVGYTKGFGHFQFSDALFAELLDYVRDTVLDDPRAKAGSTVYGAGPNWRFRVIRTALKALDIPEDSLQHNVKREVFLAPTAVGWDSYLRGEIDEVEPFDLPMEHIGKYYRERWAIGRAERRPGFALWDKAEGRLLPKTARLGGIGERTRKPGRVDMGAFSLAVGIAAKAMTGRTPSGVAAEGVAYLSRLEGRGLTVTLADIEWSNGEREVRGWDRHDSASDLEDVIGRLRIGIHASERFRSQSVMEMRMAVARGDRASVVMTTAEKISALVGFDIVEALDRLSEATVGTREQLLKDSGKRRNQLCAVFNSEDRVTPAVVWAITRVLSLVLVDAKVSRPTAPMLQVAAPTLQQMGIEHAAPPAA